MKKILTAILIALCMFPVFSETGRVTSGVNTPPVISKFDINAYFREPLTTVDTFFINVYDTISMRDGALNVIEASDIAQITDTSYMNIDPYLLDMVTDPGVAIITVDCNGKVGGSGASHFVEISADIMDINSKAGAIKKSTGFQKVGSHKTVIPYTLKFMTDKVSDTKVVTASPETVMSGGAKHKITAKSLGTDSKPKDWNYKGSLYLLVNQSDYDLVPMGKYRTIIKINITTGK